MKKPIKTKRAPRTERATNMRVLELHAEEPEPRRELDDGDDWSDEDEPPPERSHDDVVTSSRRSIDQDTPKAQRFDPSIYGDDEYLTIVQVGAWLQMHPRTVRKKLITTGLLKCSEFGEHTIRVQVKDVRDLAERLSSKSGRGAR